MQLKRIKNTQATEITINGRQILFSYSTPVACKGFDGAFKTEKFHSKTTTRHINNWLKHRTHVQTLPQESFDTMVESFDTMIRSTV